MLLASDWIQMKNRFVWEFGDKGKGRSYQMSGDDRDDRKYQRFLVFCLSSRKVPEMSNVILVIWKRVLYGLPVTWPTPPYLHSPQRLFRSHLPLPLTNTITTSCSSIARSDHPWPWCWTRKDTGWRPAAAAAICQNIVQPTSQSRPLAERSVSSPDGSHAFPSRWTHLLSFRCHLHQLLEDLSSCCLLCCTCCIFSTVRWAFHHQIHVFWRLRLLHRFQGNWSWRRRSLCQAPWDLKQSLVSFGITWNLTHNGHSLHTSMSYLRFRSRYASVHWREVREGSWLLSDPGTVLIQMIHSLGSHWSVLLHNLLPRLCLRSSWILLIITLFNLEGPQGWK